MSFGRLAGPRVRALSTITHPWKTPALLAHSALLCRTYEAVMLQPLVAGPPAVPAATRLGTDDGVLQLATALWTHPGVVVSHGVEDGPEGPVFNYGNAAALALFELPWDRFTRLHSRYSAEPGPREERARIMEALAHDPAGVVKGYSGIRVSSSGRRFRIEDGVIWNLADEAGRRVGQAATFSRWTFL